MEATTLLLLVKIPDLDHGFIATSLHRLEFQKEEPRSRSARFIAKTSKPIFRTNV